MHRSANAWGSWRALRGTRRRDALVQRSLDTTGTLIHTTVARRAPRLAQDADEGAR